MSEELLEKYVGNYEISADYHIKISRKGKKLLAQMPNESIVAIFADKENSFFVKEEDVRIKFRINTDKSYSIIFYKGLNSKVGDKVGNIF